jgi:hypothetical protein
MKFELIDITGNRWTTKEDNWDLRNLRSDIRNGLELEVNPYGYEPDERFEHTQWYLCGDKVVAYREDN